jgi:hypothetical protein
LPDKALEDLEAHRPPEELIIDGDESGLSTAYHYNQINSWDSIKDAFYDIIESTEILRMLMF